MQIILLVILSFLTTSQCGLLGDLAGSLTEDIDKVGENVQNTLAGGGSKAIDDLGKGAQGLTDQLGIALNNNKKSKPEDNPSQNPTNTTVENSTEPTNTTEKIEAVTDSNKKATSVGESEITNKDNTTVAANSTNSESKNVSKRSIEPNEHIDINEPVSSTQMDYTEEEEEETILPDDLYVPHTQVIFRAGCLPGFARAEDYSCQPIEN